MEIVSILHPIRAIAVHADTDAVLQMLNPVVVVPAAAELTIAIVDLGTVMVM